MSIPIVPPEKQAVVICEPERFLQIWKTSGTRRDVLKNETNWTRDHKFAEAAKGFAGGEQNPVPLARIVFDWRISPQTFLTSRFGRRRRAFEAEPCLDFIDGITRTIWLLQNRARYFPVMCCADQAQALHDIIGLGNRVYGAENFT